VNKSFKNYDEQMTYLNDEKEILVEERDKIHLIRQGYFNLINGYKAPFIEGFTSDGKHKYWKGTTVQHIQYVKNFDERLRYHLLEHITRIEEEIRQTFAYKFDFINSNFSWNTIEAYDTNEFNQEEIQELINDIEKELDESNLSYVRHYKNKHGFIPTWIVTKNIRFHTLIRFIKFSKVEVKSEFCDLYGIETTSRRNNNNPKLNFSVLLSTLNWMRWVRNSCAHNERVYGMIRTGQRKVTKYHRLLISRYRHERDKNLVDLFIFIKYYLPHDEYVIFIEKIKKLMLDLEGKIYEEAFRRVKNNIGLRQVQHLDLLLNSPKEIEYEKY
jgi:abortive infection bacteriophage resistance protein